jgi:hypothetical protein
VRVESVEQRKGRVRVYNFEVTENHNYFVGASGVLVHNSDCGLDELAAMRQELGLPTSGTPKEMGTLSKLEAGGQEFYGINAHGQEIGLRVNPISATHAEADAFNQAARAGINGGPGNLIVDRELCAACGRNGAVSSMAQQLGLDSLTLTTPSGTRRIY